MVQVLKPLRLEVISQPEGSCLVACAPPHLMKSPETDSGGSPSVYLEVPG